MATPQEMEGALRVYLQRAQDGDADAAVAARRIADEIDKQRMLTTERPGFGKPDPDITGGTGKRYDPNTTFGQAVIEKASRIPGNLAALGVGATDVLSLPFRAMGAAARGESAPAPFPNIEPAKQAVDRFMNVNPKFRPASAGQDVLAGAVTDLPVNLAMTAAFAPSGVARIGMGSGAFDALSALGSNFASNALKDSGAASNVLGQLAMGVALPAAVVSRGQTVANIWNARKGDLAEVGKRMQNNPELLRQAEQTVRKELAEQIATGNPETIRNAIARAKQLEAEIPGLNLDLGATTGLPSLQGAVQRLKRKEINVASEAQQANQAAMRAALGPEGGSDQAVQGLIDQRVANANRDLATLERNAAGIEQGLRSGNVAAPMAADDLARAGEEAIAGRRSLMAATRAREVQPRAQAVVEAAGDATFDTTSLVDRANSLLRNPILQYDPQNAPQVVRRIQQAHTATPQQVLPDVGSNVSDLSRPAAQGATAQPATMQDLMAMREAVNQDLAAEMVSRSPVTRERRRALMEIKNGIDEAIEGSGNQRVVDAYREFNRYYSQEFAPRFLRGVNALPDVRRIGGDPRLTGENAFREWFKPGGRESGLNAGRFMELFKDQPDQIAAMRSAVLDRYYSEVVAKSADGIVDPKKHAAFFDKMRYGNALSALQARGLNVAGELEDAAQATVRALENRAEIARQMKAINEDAFLQIMQNKWTQVSPNRNYRPGDLPTPSVDFASDPAAVFGKALGDPTMARALSMRLTSKEAPVVADYVRETLANRFVVNGQVDSAAIGKFLESRPDRDAVTAFLRRSGSQESADQYFRKLQAVKEASERTATTNVVTETLPGKGNVWQDELTQKVGFSSKQVFAYLRGVALGNVSPQSIGVVLGAQAYRTILANQREEFFKAIINDKSGRGMQILDDLMGNGQVLQSPSAVNRAVSWMKEHTPGIVGKFFGTQYYKQGGRNVAVSGGQDLVEER